MLSGKAGGHALDRLVDRGKAFGRARRIQAAQQPCASLTGSSFGPFAFDELDPLPERIRHDQNVGEDDGRVEIEPSQRLQRYFGRELWIAAKIEE